MYPGVFFVVKHAWLVIIGYHNFSYATHFTQSCVVWIYFISRWTPQKKEISPQDMNISFLHVFFSFYSAGVSFLNYVAFRDLLYKLACINVLESFYGNW